MWSKDTPKMWSKGPQKNQRVMDALTQSGDFEYCNLRPAPSQVVDHWNWTKVISGSCSCLVIFRINRRSKERKYQNQDICLSIDCADFGHRIRAMKSKQKSSACGIFWKFLRKITISIMEISIPFPFVVEIVVFWLCRKPFGFPGLNLCTKNDLWNPLSLDWRKIVGHFWKNLLGEIGWTVYEPFRGSPNHILDWAYITILRVQTEIRRFLWPDGPQNPILGGVPDCAFETP